MEPGGLGSARPPGAVATIVGLLFIVLLRLVTGSLPFLGLLPQRLPVLDGGAVAPYDLVNAVR